MSISGSTTGNTTGNTTGSKPVRPLVIGVSEAGVGVLARQLQDRIAAADLVIAAPRFHPDLQQLSARSDTASAPQKISDWPVPFSNIYRMLEDNHDKSLVILATGDPMWFGVGASLAQRLGADGCEVVPAVSGLQLAAARLGWAFSHCAVVSIHGRPITNIIPSLYPRARLLIIAAGSSSPPAVAELLTKNGFGAAQMTVLAHLGGAEESRFDGKAETWDHPDIPDFHILAVDCGPVDFGAALMPRPLNGFAAPDSSFDNDGKLTKHDVRASALAKLAPFPGAVLWDIGSGSGAVSIDFLRSAGRGSAFAIDRSEKQQQFCADNAARHGVSGVHFVLGEAEAVIGDLPTPDAIFIGGGMSPDIIKRAQASLRGGGVLVAHAVTIESESQLVEAWQKTGGSLTRISVQHADPVGAFHGWRPLMPVTRWCWHKGETK